MTLQTLELWDEDKASMEYMLDRLIIAKVIESTGKTVPGNYKFYYEGSFHYADSEVYVENVEDFLEISGIGKLKYRNLDNHDLTISIHLYALDEILFYELTESHKTMVENICSYMCDYFGEWERCTIEGTFKTVGTRLFIRGDGMYGPATEFCESLLEIHEDLQAIIKVLKTKPKGVK